MSSATRKKKRKGIFRGAVRGRAAVIQVLLDFGLSWNEVADHFAQDAALGNASGAHFASEWSRLRGEGYVVNEELCASLKAKLLDRDSVFAGWGVVREAGNE